ncbi:MAG: outer membrane beta-barrel protein [Bdellovibrionales bacterium]|nr:outer membrane beta-barrel protein [Bdellovibrionales bacterium]
MWRRISWVLIVVVACGLGRNWDLEAQEFRRSTGAMYLKAAYGLNVADGIDFQGGNGQDYLKGTSTVDTGSVWFLSAGYRFNSNFALELEYAQRSNNYDSASTSSFSVNNLGSLTAQSLMINGLGYYDGFGQVLPYAGIGLGSLLDLESEISIDEFGGTSDLDGSVFAAQAILGIEVVLAKHLRPFVEARFFTASSPTVTNQATSYNVNYDTVALLLGVSVPF